MSTEDIPAARPAAALDTLGGVQSPFATSATYDPRLFELEGSSTYALCDEIDAHPLHELSLTALASRSLIATTAKLKRYQSVLLGAGVDPEKHRATRALEVSTVDQLARWAGDGMELGERRRLVDRALARAADGKRTARPLDALLETASDEDKRRWIEGAPLLKGFWSHPWSARALAGQDEPGASLVTKLTMSRRAALEWARALVAQRRRFASDLEVAVRSQRDDGATREALEVLAHGQLTGLVLERSSPVGFDAYADSLPEGLRRLSLAAVSAEDVAAFAARSSLRSVDALAISTRDPCMPALLALIGRLDAVRSLALAVSDREPSALKSVAASRDLRSLEALSFRGAPVTPEDFAALQRACGALRAVDLSDVQLTETVARDFAASPALSAVESVTFASWYRREMPSPPVEAFASALRCAGLRRFEWRGATFGPGALDAMAGNESFAALHALTFDNLAGGSASALVALLDRCALASLDLGAVADPSVVLRAISLSRSATTLRELSLRASVVTIDDLAPLFASERLAGLESLSFMQTEASSELIEQLAKSPVGRSLFELTMLPSRFGPGSARALCESGLCASLSRLTIPYRGFSEDELWMLKRAFGPALELQ